MSHSNYAFTSFHVSRQACRPWTHHVAFMYKQTVSKKEIFPYFCRYGSVHNSIVIRLSSQASTCSQLAQKIDSELIAFLSRANSFKTNHSFCLITGQFWFAGVFFWGDRNKLKKMFALWPRFAFTLCRNNESASKKKQKSKQNKTEKKKKLASGRRPCGPPNYRVSQQKDTEAIC